MSNIVDILTDNVNQTGGYYIMRLHNYAKKCINIHLARSPPDKIVLQNSTT